MKYLYCLVFLHFGFACQTQVEIIPFKSYDVRTFREIIDSTENIIVLDVRTPVETSQGKIDGAIEVDVKAPSFEENIKKLDRNIPYAVYCRSGRRSKIAMNLMKSLGFKEVYDLDKGYISWVNSKE